MKTWIGADPGGEGKFGVAVLHSETNAVTVVTDSADGAVDFVRRTMKGPPSGIGVDAPLWWSSGPTGIRHADRWIRERHGLAPKNVQAVNSMWGAVLAQGMLFVARMREAFPGIPVTEAHPKAVLAALSEEERRHHFGVYAQLLTNEKASEDRRDAIIAALAAREGFEGRWTHDLSAERDRSEQDPQAHWLAPVRYFWPV